MSRPQCLLQFDMLDQCNVSGKCIHLVKLRSRQLLHQSMLLQNLLRHVLSSVIHGSPLLLLSCSGLSLDSSELHYNCAAGMLLVVVGAALLFSRSSAHTLKCCVKHLYTALCTAPIMLLLYTPRIHHFLIGTSHRLQLLHLRPPRLLDL